MEPLSPTLWRTCRALANKRRQTILELLLKESPLQVKDIEQRCGLSAPQASLHLRALNARGLLMAERRGACVFYRAIPDPLVPQASAMLAAFAGSIVRGESLTSRMKAFTAFTHPRRIALVAVLADHPVETTVLRATCKMSYPALYRHMDKLARRGIVVNHEDTWTLAEPVEGLAGALLHLALRDRSTRRTAREMPPGESANGGVGQV